MENIVEAKNLKANDVIRILGTEVIVTRVDVFGEFDVLINCSGHGWIVPANKWVRTY